MIAVSVLMAVLFTRLPEWTTWTILAAIAIYDLFAVLCPRGPLRMLVETAQERNENIPALLYNTIITLMASTPTNGTNGVPPFGHDEDEDDGLVAAPSHVPLDLDGDEDHRDHENENGETNGEDINGEHEGDERRVETFEIEEERSGVKLGLGDFIFYSVLVGRAALFDMLTVFTSFVGIITGLFGTILLLALWKKALPALPLSILFGVIFFFVSRFLLLPFATTLTAHSVIV
jgi:presenilin 1